MPARLNEADAREIMLRNGFTPLVAYPGANSPWKLKCMRCKQTSSPTLGSIKSGTGCGVCSQRIIPEKWAIAVMIKAKLKPLEPFPGGRKNWKCQCLKCKSVVYPKYANIKQGDGGCKYCGKNFVDATEAEQIMLEKGLKPLEPYPTSQKPWKCECLICGRVVTPQYASVKNGRGGCKHCAKRYVDAEDAIIFMKSKKLDPLERYSGSQKPWKCQCLRCGKIVTPQYASVRDGQGGCVYCGGKKVDPDEAFNFMQSKNLEPLESYKRADGPWKCRCNKCKKIVTPKYSSVRQGQGGCIYCAGNKVDPKDAVALFLKNDLEPLEPFKHTEHKWKSKCLKCKRIVYPKHHTVKQRSGGCKYCANRGMDFTKPGFIYLMTHPAFQSHKIGISGIDAKEDRVNEHSKQGWVLFKRKNFKTADKALAVEQAVLEWLRSDRQLMPFLSQKQMSQKGWTETVDANEIDLVTIWLKVEELSKSIKGQAHQLGR